MTAHILNCLDTVTRDHPNAGVILLGDFNRLHDVSLLAYPLKEAVRSPTRKEAILDKIYTNLQDRYRQPTVIPNIGNSDHRAVLMSPAYSKNQDRGKDIVVTVRSQDANRKTLLAHAIQNVNWSPLYAMQGCDEMVTCFYDTITGVIDHYLPCVAMKRHTNDKPWVTDKFRRLIRCRQNAMVSGEKMKYRMLRNRVQRMSRQLRRKYYDRKVSDLRENKSRSWWRSVKEITAMESKSTVPLCGLADELQHEGAC